MTKERELEIAHYYDTHSTYGEFVQAEKDGTLYVTEPGESYLDSIPKIRELIRKVPVSIRLTNGLLKKARGQAEADGVPLGTYLASIVYNAVSERPWAAEAEALSKKKKTAQKKPPIQIKQPAKMKRAA